MGHLIPVIELGKNLVMHHNFDVTVFVVQTHASISQSQLLELSPDPNLINIVLLPPVDISDIVQPTTLILTQLAMMMRKALPSLRSEISSMKIRPTVLIVDLFGTEAFAMANEFRMLKYVFITSTAWFLALTIYLPTIDRGEEDEHVNNQEPLNIPGCFPVRFKDTFEPLVNRDDQIYVEYVRMGKEISMADGILVNTWRNLEPKTLRALEDPKMLGRLTHAPVYPVGPLVRPVNPGSTSEVLTWLDVQPNESVVYVSFGSGGTLSAKQTTELAAGLELSQLRFLWVVRPPFEYDAAAALFRMGERCDETPSYLPDGFLTRTRERGLVVPTWAPQAEILDHPSIGGFVSHCGWNSSLESIVNGVPMVTWPLYAEQRMNAAMLTEEVGVAIRVEVLSGKEVVGREEIAAAVTKIMVEKEGEEIRVRAKTLKSTAKNALSKGGSSYKAMDVLADECNNYQRCIQGRALGA
ncbi:hypothetical protein HS088_TW01G00882 [Tripterygium wilfordii]|uniref:Glycosyltransferase n=2 Tax=Tripterygium wilfordii TaxID=458696 RepID=A0A7J7E3D7_TRIWF|nr:hypothetical protein HS088_TW01G00882 [Tripterygium wilfordii]